MGGEGEEPEGQGLPCQLRGVRLQPVPPSAWGEGGGQRRLMEGQDFPSSRGNEATHTPNMMEDLNLNMSTM